MTVKQRGRIVSCGRLTRFTQSGEFILTVGSVEMNILKKMLPYLLIILIALYILPATGKYWGSEMLLMLVAIPAACLIISFVYGIRNGFHLFFPACVGIIFIPSIFLFYNYTAWP